MKSENRKRLLALIVVMVLGLFCLTGCNTQPQEPTEPGEPTIPTDPSEPSTPVETIEMPNINAACFFFGVENFEGTVEGETFSGVKLSSATINFKPAALEAITEYASANDLNTLRIHAYIGKNSLGFQVANRAAVPGKWSVIDVPMQDVDENLTIAALWDKRAGTNYLWFEFVNADVTLPMINASALEGGISLDYADNVYGAEFEGIYMFSEVYQPHFRFTEAGIATIQAHAAETGTDALLMTFYADLTTNDMCINGSWILSGQWNSIYIPIDAIADTDIWSASEGITHLYMTFEFVKMPVITAESFEGGPIDNRVLFTGNVHGRDVVAGVSLESYSSKPTFRFTADAVAAIQAYAAENGYTTLRINCYNYLLNNDICVVCHDFCDRHDCEAEKRRCIKI